MSEEHMVTISSIPRLRAFYTCMLLSCSAILAYIYIVTSNDTHMAARRLDASVGHLRLETNNAKENGWAVVLLEEVASNGESLRAQMQAADPIYLRPVKPFVSWNGVVSFLFEGWPDQAIKLQDEIQQSIELLSHKQKVKGLMIKPNSGSTFPKISLGVIHSCSILRFHSVIQGHCVMGAH
eukprot:m.138755 g.138755  ORF g.138755 m.138755 type:complete len:181 (-) comp14781_c0_seq2:634-1176(-)